MIAATMSQMRHVLSCRWPVAAFVIALLACVTALAPARAASPEGGDSVYRLMRYNDDFTALKDPAKRSDFWDPIKYIPLGAPFDSGYLSFGGELRERFESYQNPNFGIRAPGHNAYLLHRLLLHADLHADEHLRFFLQFGQFQRIGERGLPSTTDIDRLDLTQGFVDFTPPTPWGDGPTLRAGRAEMAYGFQRLVAVREGPNVRRAFDGVRAIQSIGGATINLFAVRPVADYAGVFDDRTNMKQALWGSYVTVPVWGPLSADLYWFGYENLSATYRGRTGHERRNSFGTRLFGKAAGWDWNAEAVLQSGTFANQSISAWMVSGIAGYTFRSLPWQPRLGLEGTAASGDDRSSATIGTFNPMYPRLPYFAETSLLVPANVYDIRPVVSFTPLRDVTVVLGWDMLWRMSTTDGLYGSGMTMYPGTNRVTASRVGTEVSFDIRWRPTQHLTLGAIAAEFRAGPAITAAGGKNVDFFALFATYKI
ncbi:Alginate export family protein [Rhodovastum atsumiense]|nr:Alginate export family protein [Rhodovastum atsumiense]